MSSTLTILFTPVQFYGHINACIGIAEKLHEREHRVVFAIDKEFEGKLSTYGFDEELVENSNQSEDESQRFDISDHVFKNMDVFKEGSLTITEQFVLPGFLSMTTYFMERDDKFKEIIERVKPDLIVIDSFIGSPTLTNSGIPWVWLFSAVPLLPWGNKNLPPPFSGFPSNGDPNEWEDYSEKFFPLFDGLSEMVQSWYSREGAPFSSNSSYKLHPTSQYLNIYMYPKDLDYEEAPENWLRVDGFVRTTRETFEIPESLIERPGKLIFLSMGSIGCSHIDLMKRIVGILEKSEHRFIVATGPLNHMYTLAENMWGQPYVPQTAVIPVVDLVITHGGNNTVTECFFYGKPMLVLPIFGDQFENAQRIQETGLGLRIDPFNCTEDELLSSVDRLLNDSELEDKIRTIGETIRSNDDKQMIADYLEQIAEQNQNQD